MIKTLIVQIMMSALLLGSLSPHSFAQTKKATPVTDTYSLVIDKSSIAKRWPEGREMPELIGQIADLVKPWPWGCVAYVRMPGRRFNDFWIEGGADLWDQFGMFVNFADGTDVAIWYHDGAVPGAEPVVEIGSEGSLKVLAPNLKTFMTMWASGEGHSEFEVDPDDETPQTLADRKVRGAQMMAVINKSPDPPASAPIPDLAAFIEAHGKRARDEMANDPVLQAIGKLLAAHYPTGKEAWASTSFDIRVAGPRIEILPTFVPPSYKKRGPLPERDALIPLILKAREARAQGRHVMRGLWHRAQLKLYDKNTVVISGDWESAPDFEGGGPLTKAELAADLTRFPRSPRWREAWMDAVN